MSKGNSKKPRRSRVHTPFADNLNRILKSRGISLRAAAELAGVSVSTITDWTAGSAPNDLNKVATLARALNVSFEYLCLGTESDRDVTEIPLEALFDEQPNSEFEGIFKIKAVRLVRKKKV